MASSIDQCCKEKKNQMLVYYIMLHRPNGDDKFPLVNTTDIRLLLHGKIFQSIIA
jgi:hypothetical protein